MTDKVSPIAMRRFDTLEAWLAWQETLHPRAIDLGLERVRSVAALLGVQTATCPVISVGGTNGKGSGVAMLDAILSASGFRVGTFSSPHLLRYNERIRIAGQLIDDESLVDAFERIEAARGDTSLTFFEFNTLAALLTFRTTRPDAIVLEVGLGGRLDAVNLVDSEVALLTSIGLDHLDWLGKSVADIGREKAGIFRRGRPAILGSRDMPETVFEAAAAIGADLRFPPRDFSYERTGTSWNWQGRAQRFDRLPAPALAGDHQFANAAAVLAVLEAARDLLPVEAEGLATGLRQVKLGGRFEVVAGRPEWIFDVAHNPAAAGMLAATLARHHEGRTIAVVGILKDKDAAGIVAPLRPLVDEWVAVDLPGPRGMSAGALRDLCARNDDRSWTMATDVAAACDQAQRRARPADRVLVFGSFLTVGPALAWRSRRA